MTVSVLAIELHRDNPIAGSFARLTLTSSTTYGVVNNVHVLIGARLKTSLEAPAGEAHAEINTLISRKILTVLDETVACPPHQWQSNSPPGQRGNYGEAAAMHFRLAPSEPET
jgi:hypothetical protein